MLVRCMYSMKTAGMTDDVDDVSHEFMSVCEKSVFVKPTCFNADHFDALE